MKNNVLEKIEEINEEKKLSEDSKKEILAKIFDNLIIAINIVVLFTILIGAGLFLDKQNLTNIYNMSSIIMLIFTIFVFELAYKKDSGSLAICGIEMLVFSIAILFMPYSLIRLNAISLKLINIYVGIYYIAKVIIMYNRYKSKTILENSDIKQIVKKESRDSKVEEAIEEIKKNKEEVKEKEKDKAENKKATKKKTTKKASTTKKETNKSKTETKKATKSKSASTKKENSEVNKTNKSKTQLVDEKESNETKSTAKKATTTKNKTEVNDNNTVVPKKRGRPRKETSNK